MLLTVCNVKYEFTLIDVGHARRQSDSGVYNNSKLCYAIDNNMLDFTTADIINGYNRNKTFPYTFVADEAFALKTHMMRPYPRRNTTDMTKVNFNYRLSRARQVIENAFGLLESRFRVFRRPIIDLMVIYRSPSLPYVFISTLRSVILPLYLLPQ